MNMAPLSSQAAHAAGVNPAAAVDPALPGDWLRPLGGAPQAQRGGR